VIWGKNQESRNEIKIDLKKKKRTIVIAGKSEIGLKRLRFVGISRNGSNP
jgi:hypothetical protein